MKLENSILAQEITPVLIQRKTVEPLIVSRDEHPRRTSMEALTNLNLTIDRMDVIELNEAFFAQGLAVMRRLERDDADRARRLIALA